MQNVTAEQMLQLRRIYKRREDLWAFIKYNMVSEPFLLTDCFAGVLSSKGEKHQLEISTCDHPEWQKSDAQFRHQEPCRSTVGWIGCCSELGDFQRDPTFPGIYASWVETWSPQAGARFCLGYCFGTCRTMGSCFHQRPQATKDYEQIVEWNST